MNYSLVKLFKGVADLMWGMDGQKYHYIPPPNFACGGYNN